MIEATALQFAYRAGEPVLDHCSLAVPSGMTLLVGPNGSGKSSLMRLMAGVEQPHSGAVHIDGIDLWQDEVAARRRLAYAPETPDLTAYATIGEIIRFVSAIRGAEADHAESVLGALDLQALRNRTVRELSHGQQRRAVLATAMLAPVPNLLLDEPLEALDTDGREFLLEWLRQRALVSTVIVVSHELEPFLGIARAGLTIRDGRCHEVATVELAAARRSADRR